MDQVCKKVTGEGKFGQRQEKSSHSIISKSHLCVAHNPQFTVVAKKHWFLLKSYPKVNLDG